MGTIWSSGWFPTTWSIKFRPAGGLRRGKERSLYCFACNFIKNSFFLLKSKCSEVIYWINVENNLCICSILLTVLLTEDPGTEALCSLAGKGLCKGRGTQWVCVSCPHTKKKNTLTLSCNHFHFDVCFTVYFIHPYIPFEWRHTWPFRGCPPPPRAPEQWQLLAPWLSEGGELLVVWKERSKAALETRDRPLLVAERKSCSACSWT